MRLGQATQNDAGPGGEKRVRMLRLMLGLPQTNLGDALGVTFQQVQKYEKGTNRISASSLQRISEILQVPVTFFFEGAPRLRHHAESDAASPQFVSDYLATSEGLHLTPIKSRALSQRVAVLSSALRLR
jgi:transcriptional regulator with XRE-family HTH domain